MRETPTSVLVYALSSCVHCRKAIDFFKAKGLEVEPVVMDKLRGEDRLEAVAAVRKINPRLSLPTLIMQPGDRVFIGFNLDEIKEVYEL